LGIKAQAPVLKAGADQRWESSTLLVLWPSQQKTGKQEKRKGKIRILQSLHPTFTVVFPFAGFLPLGEIRNAPQVLLQTCCC
jgi:hypothetical protein